MFLSLSGHLFVIYELSIILGDILGKRCVGGVILTHILPDSYIKIDFVANHKGLFSNNE